jgi:catechol 2,3-dioxygenase-like lactoylglutathione lyase family enzyme
VEPENKYRVSQVGFVVRDMDKVVTQMRRIFGAEPVYGRLPEHGKKKYHGEDASFDAIIAFYRFAGIELEFVQPVSGKSIWQDFLDSGREGIHHVRFNVNSFDGTVEEMRRKDIAVSQEGESTRGIPGLRWGYFDSEEPLSFIFEIFNEAEATGKSQSR